MGIGFRLGTLGERDAEQFCRGCAVEKGRPERRIPSASGFEPVVGGDPARCLPSAGTCRSPAMFNSRVDLKASRTLLTEIGPPRCRDEVMVFEWGLYRTLALLTRMGINVTQDVNSRNHIAGNLQSFGTRPS